MPTNTAGWVGQVLDGRYEVTALVGSGGMALLYRARDRRLGCDVAVKVPQPALLQERTFAARFSREVRALVRLTHPHVVKVSDAGEHDGLPFAVLQYLGGGSLRTRQRLNDAGRALPGKPEDLRGWLADVAGALDSIHKQGYLHRDVKPDNILFDADGHVYVSDFGIAKAVADQQAQGQATSVLTSLGMAPGTAPYMAPELLIGKAGDGRADQFGLAVTVYELLGGRVPFDGPTPTAVYEQQLQPPVPLDALLPGCPPGVAAAVQQALAREPGQRHPDCAAFARAVLQALGGPAGQMSAAVATAGLVQRTAVQTTPVACPGCGKVCEMSANGQGKQVACPACGQALRAPLALASQVAPTQMAAVPPPAALPAAKPCGSRRWTGLVGAAAAMLLVGVLLGSLLVRERGGPANREQARRPPVKLEEPRNDEPPPLVKTPAKKETSRKEGPKKVEPPAPALARAPFDATQARAYQEAWARHLGTEVEITNSLGMKLILIPAGAFTMGSPESEPEREIFEKGNERQRAVEITQPFYLGVTEVTQAQYQRVMGMNPSYFSATGDGKASVLGRDTRDFPVENVSWHDAVEFCRKLSELLEERQAGRTYQLPTEAEWEFACRGGTRSPFHYGDSLSSTQANFDGGFPYGGAAKGPYLGRTTPVASYQPNAFGLYDMHGNVWEWCADWYATSGDGQLRDPKGPQNGTSRVLRGGCWGNDGHGCRAACRLRYVPGVRFHSFGFRVVVRPAPRTP